MSDLPSVEGPRLAAAPDATPLAAGGELRFTLLPALRHVVPLAAGAALIAAVVSRTAAWRLSLFAVAIVWVGAALLMRWRRPQLVLHAAGYRVEVRGAVRLQVAWSEVRRVYCDEKERALYVDCGDQARNLLLPPERGYGFTFTNREQLYQAVLDAVPRQIEAVSNLEAATGA